MGTATLEREKGSLLVDAATPTPAESEIARQSLESLKRVLGSGNVTAIETELRKLVASRIQGTVFRLLVTILEEFSTGHAVAVTSSEPELSTQQAAEYLGVSRPHVVKLVDAGLIPSRRVGSHRRIMFTDVAAYRRKSDEGHKVLDELANESQSLGLYDNEK